MSGTRAAAHDWQTEVTRTMKEPGFKQGKASPCVFWHRQRDIKALVHADDFVSSCERAELEWLCKGLKKFETKMIMVGEDDDMANQARVLNRIVRHPREGITHEAGPRHAEIISRDTGAEAAKETRRETEEKRQDLKRPQSEWKAGKQDE